jgi:8-oxo-dGTP diphosphatase
VLTIELLAHTDAGDRTRWAGDQDERPLSDLGRRQAARLAAALATAPLDGLYSSPARRCRETLAPLAERFGVPVVILPELRESHGFAPPPGWAIPAVAPLHAAVGGAYAAGRAWAALAQVRASSAAGRVAVCTHGDLVPALVAFVIGAYGLTLPPLHERRGGWYTVEVEGDGVRVLHRPVLPDFPQP